MITPRVAKMLRRIMWCEQEMERQGLTRTRSSNEFDMGEYFCMASGCLEDRTDSYGECINCGEPVVRVWDK